MTNTFSSVLKMWDTLHDLWYPHMSDLDEGATLNESIKNDNDEPSFEEAFDGSSTCFDVNNGDDDDASLELQEVQIGSEALHVVGEPNKTTENEHSVSTTPNMPESGVRLAEATVSLEAADAMILLRNEPLASGRAIEHVSEPNTTLSKTGRTLIIVDDNADPLNDSIEKKENDLIIYAIGLYRVKGYRNGEGYLKMTVMAELAALTTSKDVPQVVLPGKSLEMSVANWDGAGEIPENIPGVAYIDRYTSSGVTTFFKTVEADLIKKANKIFSGNLPEAAKMKGMMEWFHLFREVGCCLWHCTPSSSKEEVIFLIQSEFKNCGSRAEIERKTAYLCRELHQKNFANLYAEAGSKRKALPVSSPIAKKSKRSVGPPPTRDIEAGEKIVYRPASESWQQKQRQRYGLQKTLLTSLAADHNLRGDHRALAHLLMKEVEKGGSLSGQQAGNCIPFALLAGVVTTVPTGSYLDTKVVDLARELQHKGLLNVDAVAAASLTEMQNVLHSTGLDTGKAELLKKIATALMEKHGGRVPSTYDALVGLPGISKPQAISIIKEAYPSFDSIRIDTGVKMALLALEIVQLEDEFLPPTLKKKGMSKVVFEQFTDLHAQRSLQTWLPSIDLPEYIKVQSSFVRVLTEHCLLVDQGQDWEKQQMELVDLTIGGFPAQSQKELRTMVKKAVDYFKVITARNEKKKESKRKLLARRAKQNEDRKRKRQTAKEE